MERARRIDAHAHMIGDHPRLLQFLAEQGLKVMNIDVPDDQWAPWRTTEHPHYRRLAQTWPERFAWCTSFDVPLSEDEPHYAEEQIANLERDVAAGAIGVKLYYNLGEVVKRKDGDFLLLDDPLFHPIFEHIQKRGWPVVWHHGGSERARHRVLEKWRGIRFIGAHLGHLPDCLVEDVAAAFERHPNFAVDTSATVRRLLKQPQPEVRDFFIRYQDRILFGTDLGMFEEMVGKPFSQMPEEEAAGKLETLRTAYATQFAYYENEGPLRVFEWGFFEGLGLALPPAVLDKLYLKNALHWIPGLGA